MIVVVMTVGMAVWRWDVVVDADVFVVALTLCSEEEEGKGPSGWQDPLYVPRDYHVLIKTRVRWPNGRCLDEVILNGGRWWNAEVVRLCSEQRVFYGPE
jgi:hypothetical protein